MVRTVLDHNLGLTNDLFCTRERVNKGHSQSQQIGFVLMPLYLGSRNLKSFFERRRSLCCKPNSVLEWFVEELGAST